MRVLVADDSLVMRRLLEASLAGWGYEPVTAADGQQAIARIEQERPDIVLADVGMPERDGYEVAEFVKRTPHLAQIPVVLLTGAFEPIDEARARAVGCDGVLVKPFEPHVVVSRVKELLAGRRPAALWGGRPPTPAAPDRSATEMPAAAGQRTAPDRAAGGRGLESLEEYFDRLDAVFSGHDAAAAVAAPRADGAALVAPPDSAAAPPPTPRPIERPLVAPGVSSWPGGTPPSSAPQEHAEPTGAPVGPLSLADAFAALLAAEQARIAAPPAAPASPADDELVEEVVRRVLARLTDRVVRETVLDVAERLVREEIDRIKAARR